ncbi:MAG: MBL fold metallo-hydrolase [Kineosporiaceae bacterium]
MQITHLGQSCLLLEAAGVRVLVDPGAFAPAAADLRELDAIVVTHSHIDHLDPATFPGIVANNPAAAVLAEASVAEDLRGKEIEVTALRPGDSAAVGGLSLRAVGGVHAVIHEDIPLIGNVGILFSGAGEPTLFHPGDSYEVVPEITGGAVDVLGLPLVSPWAALKETVEFARAVAAPVVVPIHDALLAPPGRGLFTSVVGGFLPAGSQLRDIAGQGAATL